MEHLEVGINPGQLPKINDRGTISVFPVGNLKPDDVVTVRWIKQNISSATKIIQSVNSTGANQQFAVMATNERVVINTEHTVMYNIDEPVALLVDDVAVGFFVPDENTGRAPLVAVAEEIYIKDKLVKIQTGSAPIQGGLLTLGVVSDVCSV